MTSRLRRIARWASLCAVALAGCAHSDPAPAPAAPPPAPVAKGDGLRVLVDLTPGVSAGSDDCKQSPLVQSLPSATRRGAEKCLSDDGFEVASDPKAPHDLAAHVDTTLSYCNPGSGIATGEISLSLESDGRVIGRAVKSGDLANSLDDLFTQLAADLTHAPGVIRYTESHAAGAAKAEGGH